MHPFNGDHRAPALPSFTVAAEVAAVADMLARIRVEPTWSIPGDLRRGQPSGFVIPEQHGIAIRQQVRQT